MSFRKRNIGLSGARAHDTAVPPPPDSPAVVAEPGVRPSPVDGRPTTSTGVASLDALLAGHAGLALGTSLLIEEGGTTDYAGALLRYYAAEGVLQKHRVHVVGVTDQWARDLPGAVGTSDGEPKRTEKMKIAWRYESLGEFGAGKAHRAKTAVPEREIPRESIDEGLTLSPESRTFCHSFDLTKRLVLPKDGAVEVIPISADPRTSPFDSVIRALSQALGSTSRTIHRLIIPSLLSPALYHYNASLPQHILQFLHGLRSLLRQYRSRLTAVVTLPLSLHPRSTGLVRWMELLSDGVLELSPFPHAMDASNVLASSGTATSNEEQPQGMLKVHSLPVFHERGGGGGGSLGLGDDLAFTLSRRKFSIRPFSLPPLEGDTEAQKGAGESRKADIEF